MYIYKISLSDTYIFASKPTNIKSVGKSIDLKPVGKPTDLKPVNKPTTRQTGQVQKPGAPASSGQIASSNPALSAGMSNWTWDKFVKINGITGKNASVSSSNPLYQQYLQGQNTFKNTLTSAYSAAANGKSWQDFLKQNPLATNNPNVKTKYDEGFQQFSQGVLTKKFPQAKVEPSLQAAFTAGARGISWDKFTQEGAYPSQGLLPNIYPNGSPGSKVPGAQQAYQQGQQFGSQVKAVAPSAYFAGVQGLSWDSYLQKYPNAINVPGAQAVYNEGLKNQVHGSSLNMGGNNNNSVAIGGGIAAALIPIILGLLL